MFTTQKYKDFSPTLGLQHGAHLPGFDDHDWIPVEVPGDVHQALITAGRLPDPFYDRNETLCSRVEAREWWYRLSFIAPTPSPESDERLRLCFLGLDSFATLWLNGNELGRHANMFHPAIFDVTNRLNWGETNLLALYTAVP